MGHRAVSAGRSPFTQVSVQEEDANPSASSGQALGYLRMGNSGARRGCSFAVPAPLRGSGTRGLLPRLSQR